MARILIDALGVDSPGGRRHLEGLLSGLATRPVSHRLELLVRASSARQLDVPAGGVVTVVPLPDGVSRSIAGRLLVDLVWVPLRALRRRFDLVVTLANFGPVWTPGVPHLVVQQNAMQFSDEYLGRIAGVKRLEWRLRGRLCALEMRFATLNVTPSDSLAALIRRAYPGLARKPFRTLPHGIDLSAFKPGPSRGPGAEPFVFVNPTKIEAYKGLEVLAEAVRILAAERRDFEVRVTAPGHGWPGDVQRALDAVGRTEASDRLRFIGSQPANEMPRVYRAADAVVYPTLCESFGFPLLESMACGLPIVAGDLDVNRELCGEAAHYYPAKSAEGCALAMKRVLEDAGLRLGLQDASRRAIESADWSWETYAARFVTLCELALEGGPSDV